MLQWMTAALSHSFGPVLLTATNEEVDLTDLPEDALNAMGDTVNTTTNITESFQGTTDTADKVLRLTSSISVPLWVLILLGVVVLLLAAAAVVVLVRSRRKEPKPVAPEEEPPEGPEEEQLLQTELPKVFSPQVGKLHAQGSREGQQDCFSATPEELYPNLGLLAVVADGMGGLESGDEVSQTAVTAIVEGFYASQTPDPAQELLQLLSSANGAVNRMLGLERIGQCGSTVVVGLLKNERFYFLSVGDSRIYLYRDGVLMQLNREHIYRRELELWAVNGEGTLTEARTHPRASGLTSFLGMGQLRYLDQPDAPVEARPGDRFVLMSDGVYNALPQDELCRALELDTAQAAADALGQAVEGKSWPGQDNYTALIIQC
ncbi:MAG: serine/threonine-protein phosphatase [Clostridiales bacterium]|nr:serine/threonine-protein phosphatase [Clostridiales bacterium]